MCCGRSSTSTIALSDAAKDGMSSLAPLGSAFQFEARFEYTGKTALTVVSPRTGTTYRFGKPGAVVTVLARDQSWMSFVPNLRRVA